MRYLLLLIGLLGFSACHQNAATKPETLLAEQTISISTAGANSSEPAIAAAADGSLYLAWVDHHEDGQSDLMFSRLNPGGEKQTTIRVNPQPGVATAWRGDAPQIALTPDHAIVISWTAKVKTEAGQTTDIYLSVSRDQGSTFSEHVKVNDDSKPVAHGMHSLAVGPDGAIYLAWLDERNTDAVPTKEAAMKKASSGHHMESNREVFIASSRDSGRTFSQNTRVATEACPCCKTALAIGRDNRLYVSWRQVLPGNFRHIAVASSQDGAKTFSKPTIVSDDQWMLAGCPVSGPSMTVSGDGALNILWYSAGKNGDSGVYLSESKDGGGSFAPRRMIVKGEVRGTPSLLAANAGNSLTVIVETQDQKILGLKDAGSAPFALPVADGALPATTVVGRQLATLFVTKEGEKQRVSLVVKSLAS